ncbi:MAG: cyclodeaminase/cyclohydrolase family protein [Lachnospiraceae bacterium]|nr:cyclodeaminase/cyclohydrolase family protein [Lachnospiraceae bacterium]
MLEKSTDAIRNETIGHYCEALGSKLPTPGGGGASAVAGAFGCSLGLKVLSFTLGKKRYADIEDELKQDQEALLALRDRFYALAEEDERAFAPLASAYRLPEETAEEKEKKQSVMEGALHEAAAVPLQIMEEAAKALRTMEHIAQKGSKMAITDAGVGGDYLSTALKGAMLNVLINAKSMRDKAHRDECVEKAGALLDEGAVLLRSIEETVLKRI